MADCMGAECSAGCGFSALPACLGCLVSTCSAETDACEGDTECNQWLDCAAQCANPGCQATCYAALTDETKADAFVACMQGACAADCSG